MKTQDTTGGRMVNIGEIVIAQSPEELVWSVLGSCVSVIMRAGASVALICHAQMPARKEFGVRCTDSCPHPCFNFLPDSMELRYVSCAIEYMLNYLNKNRLPLSGLSTTLIGGASKLKDMSFSIGDENLRVARETLDRNGITLNRSLTGGDKGYTFWYRPGDDSLVYRIHESPEKRILAPGRHITTP